METYPSVVRLSCDLSHRRAKIVGSRLLEDSPRAMPLKLRPTDLGSGIDKDRPDYTVYTGEWEVGRIFETRGQPENLRWFWSLTINGPMMRSGRVASLEEAKAQLQKSWDAWKAWAKLEEVA